MRIVRFSSPNHVQPFSFQDQKISLSKLSEVKARSNFQYLPKQQNFGQNLIKQKKAESHIKWVNQNNQNLSLFAKINHQNVKIQHQPAKVVKKTARRKIFQNDDNSKQNFQIPTFSQMPSLADVPASDQQIQYYSIVMNSPKQQSQNLMTSKISESNQFCSAQRTDQYRSPFKANEQNNSHYNSRYAPQNCSNLPSANNMLTSNISHRSIEKSSLLELTQYHIPKLQQKLQQHDKQLATIKQYLNNSEKLKNLGESIKQYQQIKVLTQKQKQIQLKKELLMTQIQKVRQMESNINRDNSIRSNIQADQEIEKIQKQRLKRLYKMQRQNQILYQNLKSLQYEEQQEEAEYQSPENCQYKFQGPVAFPSKDWESERQIVMQASDGFKANSTSKMHFHGKKKSGNTVGQVQISPVLKRKMNEISSIGFSNNKTESFSIEANTFRQIMSPLEFQGQNSDMNSW